MAIRPRSCKGHPLIGSEWRTVVATGLLSKDGSIVIPAER
jgi:hypothetical protein